MKIQIALAAICGLTATLLARPAAVTPPPVAGNIELGKTPVKGQTKKSFSAPAGTGSSVTFKVKATLVNDSGGDYNDLTININKDPKAPEDETKPTDGGTTLKRPAGGSSATAVGSNTSKGTSAHINFSGSGGNIGAWKDPEVLYGEVTVTAKPGQSLVLELNPSRTNTVPADPSAHADSVGTLDFSGNSSSRSVSVLNGFNSHTVAGVRNVDRAAKAITAISGEIKSSDSGVAVTNAFLTIPGTRTIVPGANVQVNGAQFTITGFPPLQPRAQYDVVVTLNQSQPGDYELAISSTYAQ